MSSSPAPNLSPQAFQGTAADYARYRPRYPRSLIADLVRRSAPNKDAKLLDLACGPGRFTFEIAKLVDEVWAVDREPDMIEVATSTASRNKIDNVRWSVGSAESFTAPADYFDMVTVSDAFHRLDQPRIAELAHRWLKPGGRIVILGSEGVLNGESEWQRIVVALARQWTKPLFPNGWGVGEGDSAESNKRVLSTAGFRHIVSYDFVDPHEWRVEEIAGYLRSTSVCSQRILGDNAPAFERALIEALQAYDRSGVYRAEHKCGYTLAYK